MNLAALYDNDVGILLVDEPDSLHPQLQAFLLREIQAVAGNPVDPTKKIVILATHSLSMLAFDAPQNLAQIIFFSDAETSPHQVAADAGELRSKNVKTLLPRIGQTHREAFFSIRPLLIEGTSDEVICNALDHSLNIYLGAAGSHLVPVGGTGQMPAMAKLMRVIGKTPVVLADLDGLADNLDLVKVFLSS